MIISFDGNVYSGKTTIINKFPEKYCKIKEYCNYISLVDEEKKFDNKYMDLQLKYLKIDMLRIKDADFSKVILLDRSFISLCAHVWALYKLDKVDIRKEFLDFLKEHLKKNKIIIPDILIHVKCDYAIAKNRFIKNENAKIAKGTDSLLIDEKYFFFINEFNERLQKELGQNMVIDTVEGFKEILFKIKKCLKTCKRNDKNRIIKAIEKVYKK